MTIAEKIKFLLENGWLPEALGKELGVTRMTIYRWKEGTYIPSMFNPVDHYLDVLIQRVKVGN
tara:strand:+ start:1075 stop:1263 length:189 start_codon:yes stop_codon:yes gene_type:complete